VGQGYREMSDPHDPCRPYRLMARQNALANLRLLNACARLKPGEWEAERTSFFPSLQRTLNHLYTVDLLYIDALEGGTRGFTHRDNQVPLPALADLRAAQMALDARLVAFCDALAPGDLGRAVRIYRGPEPGVARRGPVPEAHFQVEPLGETLLHVALHAVHHRGQAHAMLSGTSVAPPQLDEFVCRSEGRFRTEEMAALGWSEDYLAS